MTHVETQIERYFSGEVTSQAAHDALFGHLDRCEQCRDYFDDLARGHRALTGHSAMSATELALLMPSVLDRAQPAERKPRLPSWVWSVFGPALAATFALLFLSPGGTSYRGTKGGAVNAAPVLEALCFDEDFNVVRHLASSGECPAPGYVKVLFASPRTVPHLTVAAVTGEKIRFHARLERPKPRSVVPEYAKLLPGESVRILLTTESIDQEALLRLEPVLVVRGTAP